MKIFKFFKRNKEEKDRKNIEKQNKANQKNFAKVPFKDRIVLAPRCMRNVSVCTAIEKGPYFICQNCGGCTIDKIDKLMKSLGYGKMYILKGGSAVPKIIKEEDSKAVIGIACPVEAEPVFRIAKEKGIPAQFVLLTRDGCADTDTNMEDIEKVFSQKDF